MTNTLNDPFRRAQTIATQAELEGRMLTPAEKTEASKLLQQAKDGIASTP